MNKLLFVLIVALASLSLSHPIAFGHSSTKLIQQDENLQNRHTVRKGGFRKRAHAWGFPCFRVLVWSKKFSRWRVVHMATNGARKRTHFPRHCSIDKIETIIIKELEKNKYTVRFCCRLSKLIII